LPKTIHTERHRKLRELLKAERNAAGLTQTVVAQRLGMPPSFVAKYEGGDRRLDVLEYLDVAAVIGFDPCDPIRSLLNQKPTASPKAPTRETRARGRTQAKPG